MPMRVINNIASDTVLENFSRMFELEVIHFKSSKKITWSLSAEQFRALTVSPDPREGARYLLSRLYVQGSDNRFLNKRKHEVTEDKSKSELNDTTIIEGFNDEGEKKASEEESKVYKSEKTDEKSQFIEPDSI